MDLNMLIENISFPVLFAVFFYYNLQSTKKREEKMYNLLETGLQNNTDAVNELTTVVAKLQSTIVLKQEIKERPSQQRIRNDVK